MVQTFDNYSSVIVLLFAEGYRTLNLELSTTDIVESGYIDIDMFDCRGGPIFFHLRLHVVGVGYQVLALSLGSLRLHDLLVYEWSQSWQICADFLDGCSW